LAAVLLLFLFFFPQEFVLGVGRTAWGAFLGHVLNLLAGLYAMVQGLENVVTALREPER